MEDIPPRKSLIMVRCEVSSFVYARLPKLASLSISAFSFIKLRARSVRSSRASHSEINSPSLSHSHIVSLYVYL